MERLGVERPFRYRGRQQGILDRFAPAAEAAGPRPNLDAQEIHAQFVDTVGQGRGERLKERRRCSPA